MRKHVEDIGSGHAEETERKGGIVVLDRIVHCTDPQSAIQISARISAGVTARRGHIVASALR